MLLASESQVAVGSLARLNKDFFNDAFTSIYAAIQNYYKKHSRMPSMDALMLESNRNAKLAQALNVLAHTPIPDVDIEMAIEALEAEYTQELLLQLLDAEVLRDLPMLDKGGIIDRVASLALKLEEKVSYSGGITDANQIAVFREKDTIQLHLVPLGLCNEFDVYAGGLGRGETMLIGGFRGTGKSVVCSNIQVNQYESGLIAPYFSLEMKAEEVFYRNLAIMAGVSALDIRNQRLKDSAVIQLARTRAKMYHGGLEYFQDYIKKGNVAEMSDFFEFEQVLNEKYELHTPMPIIHDPELTSAKLDAVASRIVSQYGEDKVPLMVLDYVNQVRLEGSSDVDMYNWTDQMVVSKNFKNTCAKLNIAGISPFQIDADGRTRMSKGILDSCDMAMNLNAAKADNGKGAIMFDFTKVRSMDSKKFISPMDWKCLRIDSTTTLSIADVQAMQAEFVIPLESEPKQKKQPAKKPAKEAGEGASDI